MLGLLLAAAVAAATTDMDLQERHRNETRLHNYSRLVSPKTLVASGGGSLGAYQAGFLYYYTLFLKGRRPQDLFLSSTAPKLDRFRIAAGSSAGAINALLTLLTGCLAGGADAPAFAAPESSLFYRTWIPIGFKELTEAPDADDALLRNPVSRAVASGLAPLFEAGGGDGSPWRAEGCEAFLALPATRLRRRPIEVAEELRSDPTRIRLHRQSEKFLLHLTAGPGEAPRFAFHRLEAESHAPSLVTEVYPTLDRGEATRPEEVVVRVDDVFDLVQAASAFPLALPTKALSIRTWRRSGDGYTSDAADVRFTDGGWLDNIPLRMARDVTESVAPGEDSSYLFLLSDAIRWRRPEAANPANPPSDSIIGEFGSALFQFIDSATDTQLLEVLEESPIRSDIPGRRLPVTADLLAHFFAFVETDFRRFDFYQGMLDADAYLESPVPLPAQGASAAPLACMRKARQQAQALVRSAGADVEPPPLPAVC
ncbi:MAG TPA: patatin-like phospholipase family protein, partial [Myxococcota bacterium]|nr:patatin-like phospholipase family protein [Myxococcota bacterium]